jgi:hypothetical protein
MLVYLRAIDDRQWLMRMVYREEHQVEKARIYLKEISELYKKLSLSTKNLFYTMIHEKYLTMNKLNHLAFLLPFNPLEFNI